nr:hypothetical protein [Luteimonas aestuarii]
MSSMYEGRALLLVSNGLSVRGSAAGGGALPGRILAGLPLSFVAN